MCLHFYLLDGRGSQDREARDIVKKSRRKKGSDEGVTVNGSILVSADDD